LVAKGELLQNVFLSLIRMPPSSSWKEWVRSAQHADPVSIFLFFVAFLTTNRIGSSPSGTLGKLAGGTPGATQRFIERKFLVDHKPAQTN